MRLRKLNILQVQNAKPRDMPYMLSDGGNLYLRVRETGRSWVFRYTRAGKRAEMGLGDATVVSLAMARKKAGEARELVQLGIDPVQAKREKRKAAVPRPTFGKCAAELIRAKQSEWRNAEHRRQWAVTLETYCKPLWDMPVDAIDRAAILDVLTPIWSKTPETAARVRGRIEAVLDAARARGHIPADRANPARWKGHLDKLLAKRKQHDRGHHAAMPYADVPQYIASLRQSDTIQSLALQYLVLTAGRLGEVLGATWAEIDKVAKVWTIPATRMKGGREHRVPLSEPAMAIIERLAAVRCSQFIFPGRHGHLTRSPVVALVPKGATPHGFRSSFSDWAGEETSFPRELIEAALAHVSGDATERAYRRGDALERRRGLMEAWGQFCARQATENVLPLFA